MAIIMKGAPVAAEIDKVTLSKVEELKKHSVYPTLAILRVGEKEDEIYYERAAMKRCEKLGIKVVLFTHKEDAGQKELMESVYAINADDAIHGAIIMRPLPKHLDEKEISEALDPAKDVDGITEQSLAGVFTGSDIGFTPCTAQSCMEILKYYNVDPCGKKAVVIGRSLVIGKPVAMMLADSDATVAICHRQTKDIPQVTRQAEILVAAAGRTKMVTGEYLSENQYVLDVGMDTDEDGKLCGDVDFEQAEPIVAGITPVPGGVGAVTTSVLLSNVVKAAEKKFKK